MAESAETEGSSVTDISNGFSGFHFHSVFSLHFSSITNQTPFLKSPFLNTQKLLVLSLNILINNTIEVKITIIAIFGGFLFVITLFHLFGVFCIRFVERVEDLRLRLAIEIQLRLVIKREMQ